MLRILSIFCGLIFLLLLLLFPSAAEEGASTGILLWYRKILPVLLPFALASQMMEASNIITFFSPMAGMIFFGFCCGYPMGAVWASILVRSGKLTCRQAELFLPLCSQPSPMFLIGYLRTLIGETSILRLLISAYLPPLFLLFLLISIRKRTDREPSQDICEKGPDENFYKNPGKKFNPCGGRKKLKTTFGEFHELKIRDFESCWFTACRILLKTGAYIMVFSILISILGPLFFLLPKWKPVIFGILEMTTGIRLLETSGLPDPIMKTIGLFLACFGGCSCMAQVLACLEDSPLTGKYYGKGKIFLAIISAAFYYILLGKTSFRLFQQ